MERKNEDEREGEERMTIFHFRTGLGNASPGFWQPRAGNHLVLDAP